MRKEVRMERSTPRTPRSGAFYRDKAHNVARLLSVSGDYCAYIVYPSIRWNQHGNVVAFTRKDVFQSMFSKVADCDERSAA